MILTIVTNIVAAFIFPLIIPITYYLLANVNLKPETEEVDGMIKIKEKINIFLSELPTAFLANVLWGITLNANTMTSDLVQIWMIFYIIMTVCQFLLILYVKGKPNKRIYIRWIVISLFFTIIPSIIRIVMVCNLTPAST